MSSNPESPLSGVDYDSAIRLKEIVQRNLPMCDKMERCNVDVTMRRQAFIAMGEFADNVLREFFPNGRP